MADGFLGYPTSLMLDVVVCALALVVPTLVVSLYLVKVRKKYLWHRNIQIVLGAALLVTVVLFEADMQMQGGWQAILGRRSPPLPADQLATVRRVLWIHLVFAVTTVVLWPVTLVLAWRRYPSPPTPAAHSRLHKRLGWLSTIDIALTSATGLLFYYLAFVR